MPETCLHPENEQLPYPPHVTSFRILQYVYCQKCHQRRLVSETLADGTQVKRSKEDEVENVKG